MLVIIKGFDKMMHMKGSGIDGAITKNDVIKIFTGNEWVLNGKYKQTGWLSNNFDIMLNQFNIRKNLLMDKGIDIFIANTYDTVYERFYLNLPSNSLNHKDIVASADSIYSLVFPQPSFVDINILMNFESNLFYPEY